MHLPPLIDAFFAIFVTASCQDANLDVVPTNDAFSCRFILVLSPEMLQISALRLEAISKILFSLSQLIGLVELARVECVV